MLQRVATAASQTTRLENQPHSQTAKAITIRIARTVTVNQWNTISHRQDRNLLKRIGINQNEGRKVKPKKSITKIKRRVGYCENTRVQKKVVEVVE